MRRAIIAAMVLAAVTAYGQGRLFSFGIGQTEQVTRGLVSYWAMRNSGTTVYDEKGANSGTAVNSPTFSATNGLVGNGGGFASASSQYINVGKNSAFSSILANNFSWSFWVKSAQAGVWYITGTLNTGNTTLFNIGSSELGDDGDVELLLRDDADKRNFTYTSGNLINTASWVHVAIVKSANTAAGITYYINGALVATNVSTDETPTTYSAFAYDQTMGARNVRGTIGGYMNGALDEVRLYNVALTADEIKQLYRMGKTVYQNR